MKQYLLGLDGGGSKTAIVLTDLEQAPIAVKTLGRSNPGDIGYPAMEELLLSGMTELCNENGVELSQVVSVFAGVAGLTSFKMTETFRAAMEKQFPKAICDCSHDGMNVLYGAFPHGEDGAIVICGTGSSCFAKAGETVYRIGGYGQFDLTGNGYEMGKAAFAHVFRTLDGRDTPGRLAELLNQRFDGSCHSHIFEINGYTKTQFASFAPLVFQSAKEGDPAAMAILEQNFAYIAELISTAATCYDGKPYSVALAGGIFRDELAFSMVRQKVSPKVTLFRLDREPYLGASAKAAIQLRDRQSPTGLSSFLKP